MERLKDLGKDRTGLGIVFFLVTRAVLILVDISCVGVYFGIILCLIYFTFLKDCLEIIIYAVAKFSTRFKWLYRIFKIQQLLYTKESELDNMDETELECNTPNLDSSINEELSPRLVKNSLDPVASGSSNLESRCNSQLLSCSQSRNTSEVEGRNTSSVIFESPRSSRSESQVLLPRKLSSLSAQVVSSTDNFIINETNFESVDLSNETSETDSKSSKEDLSIQQSSSKWNMKIFDPLRKNKLPSQVSVKSQIGSLASKVTESMPHRADDNSKLISEKNDSPEQIGCCSYLPHFLRPKYRMGSIASYARF